MKQRWTAAFGVIAVAAVITLYVFEKVGPALNHPIHAFRLISSDPPAKLPVPVVGVTPRQLRNTWGAARSGGRSHRGIDIFAPRGREIVSTTGGIVVTVGQNSLGGKVVRVLGPGGQWHYYAHLERFGKVRKGQIIQPGTVVGYVGDSGNARGTQPHLHYGIYDFRGGAINPFPLLARPRGFTRRS